MTSDQFRTSKLFVTNKYSWEDRTSVHYGSTDADIHLNNMFVGNVPYEHFSIIRDRRMKGQRRDYKRAQQNNGAVRINGQAEILTDKELLMPDSSINLLNETKIFTE